MDRRLRYTSGLEAWDTDAILAALRPLETLAKIGEVIGARMAAQFGPPPG